MKKATARDLCKVIFYNQEGFALFKSANCYLCRALEPKIQRLIEKYKNINFYFVDVDDEDAQADMFRDYVDGVPSAILIKEGKFFPLKDPPNPDRESWFGYDYLDKEIIKFFKEEE